MSAPRLIIGGRPVIGGGFAAGEIGHVVDRHRRRSPLRLRQDGCLEAWLAVPRLTAQLEAIGDDAGISDAAAAEARDDILREAGRRLGIILAPVVGALNLSEVVLSGPAELLDGTCTTRPSTRSGSGRWRNLTVI